jgi:beta-N-acetylhexosaminidase
MRYRNILPFILLLASSLLNAQKPAFTAYLNDPWVAEQMERMTLREKIAQLIMIEVYPEQSDLHRQNTVNTLKKYQPGGILVMKGNPTRTTNWIKEFSEVSGIPLLVAMDAENGPGFRIDSVLNFPNAQALGAVQNDSLIYFMGRSVGRQLKSMGVNMNFAPVADINTNPANPVINFRSFGENRENVVRKTIAFAMGMQDEGIAAVAKHYPGHGDTRTDSHLTLPLLQHSSERMHTMEIFPFRQLAQAGIAGIMTGHLSIPALDPSGKPASLSEKITGQLLRRDIGYEGLIITDAMNMKGVTLPSGQAEVAALKAGNDMVEFVTDLPNAISAIEKAVATGTLTAAQIDQKCRKVLAMKKWLNLSPKAEFELSGITARLNDPATELMVRKLTEASLTVMVNDGILPLMRLDTLRIATVTIGENITGAFREMTGRYTAADHFYISPDFTPKETDELLQKLKYYNLVIAGIHGIRSYPGRSYGVTNSQTSAMKSLALNTRLITVFFGNAYAIRYFTDIDKSAALIMAYQDNRFTQELSAQLIFGATGADGKLPVSPDNRFAAGTGHELKKNGRLKYTIPEEVGISSEILSRNIGLIADEGLIAKAFPGCQVLIAKEGKVIFHKCYGFLTYDNIEPVSPGTLYDLASVTKVSGPLPALMRLYDEGKFDLNQNISYYWNDFKGSNKEKLRIRDILTHQAQLRPIIPLWESKFIRDAEHRAEAFRLHPHSETDIRISSNLYMDEKYTADFFKEIRESTLLPRKQYTYSCVGFHMWPPIISKITGIPYEDYLQDTFYRRLGATTLTYNPYKHFPQEWIAPTETDDYFRMETLRGFVHDEGAAILGGISGNAGLFGTANDLAKLFQMYLWKGYYGGEQYISGTTLDEFTRVQFPSQNRRGLGFDKPEINNHLKKKEDAYPAPSVSQASYGHSGFTGTFVWADPETELLYIFLSNRVYPTRKNNRISSLKIRGEMLEAIYESMKESTGKN